MPPPDINRWFLQGRIGSITDLQDGRETVFCKVSLATRTRASKHGEPVTEWHNVVLFRELAKGFYHEAEVGRMVRMRGYLHTHNYQNKGKNERDHQMIAEWFSFDLSECSGMG